MTPSNSEPQEAKAHLAPPQDPTERRIYWLNRLRVSRQDGTEEILRPTPEVIAVAIAKCSRFETPFDQNVDDVPLKKASEFHEKWVVGYGHSSVAEHAVSSVAIENVSQLVIKILEDTRLASFTEKSSRYQVFSRNRVVIPADIQRSRFAPMCEHLLDRLYGLYEELRGPVSALMRERYPKTPETIDRSYEAQIKARTFDVVRYLLPAAAKGSLGMTANARVWEHVISKLLSYPLEEARDTGRELRDALRGASGIDPDIALAEYPHPTLLKYADFNKYLHDLPDDLKRLADQTIKGKPIAGATRANELKPVVITQDDSYAEAHVVAALVARVSHQAYSDLFEAVKHNRELCEKILATALAKRESHDAPPREFEHACFQHEIVMDYGAWRDIQRHRMCTQTNQKLDINLGYELPEEISAVGYRDAFEQMMREVMSVHAALVAEGLVNEAEYIVPMAFRRRLLISWNLRELFHFIELRSGIKGHPSYRRIAQEVWRTLDQTHPLVAKFIRVDLRGDEATVSTVGAKPRGI